MPKDKIIEEFREQLKIQSVEYSNIGGFGYKDVVHQDVEEVIKALEEALKDQKEDILRGVVKLEKRWKTCKRKDCNNKEECERANHYIETIWNPTFADIKDLLKKIN